MQVICRAQSTNLTARPTPTKPPASTPVTGLAGSINQTAVLSVNQTTVLSVNQTAVLSVNQTTVLSVNQTAVLSVNQTATIAATQTATIAATQTATISANQTATFSINQTTAFTATQTATVSVNQTTTISAKQTAAPKPTGTIERRRRKRRSIPTNDSTGRQYQFKNSAGDACGLTCKLRAYSFGTILPILIPV